MSLPRTSDKPVSCRYQKTGSNGISKEHANRHFPVELTADVVDADGHPTVRLRANTNNKGIWGELLDVDEETEECTVQIEGLVYYRTANAYAAANNGLLAIGGSVAQQAKPSTVTQSENHNGAVIEGGFNITEGTTTVHILKCRR